MGSQLSLQFRGLESVLKAYTNKDVDCWSIWSNNNRQLMDKGEGPENLKAFLQLLENSGSEAIYTIRVYEDISDPKKIKSTTPDDGSFNFRLNEPDNYGGGTRPYGRSSQLEERFNELEEKISGFIESHAPAEEEEDTIQSAVIGLLKDPDKLGKFIEVTKSLLGQPGHIGQPALIGNAVRIAGDGDSSPSLSPSASLSTESADAKVIRLGAAIDTLEKNDPALIDHLEKLAKLSVENPKQFSQLISMLDVF